MSIDLLKDAKVVEEENKTNFSFNKQPTSNKDENSTSSENTDVVNEEDVKDEKEGNTQEVQETDSNDENQEHSKEDVKDDDVAEKPTDENVEESSLSQDKVLSYLKDKGIEVDSLDDLNKDKGTEIPEELKSYLDYKKETGRGYDDFLMLNKNWEEESEDVTLSKYLKETNQFYSDQDIKDELSEFSFDEDLDDESEVRKKKRNKKKLLNEAVSYLNSQKEKYNTKVEGSSSDEVQVPDDYKKAKDKLDEIARMNELQLERTQKVRDSFVNQTKSVLNEDFKGFEFDINGDKKVFKSHDSSALLETQLDVNNFMKIHADEEGNIKDVKSYHKSLNAAFNPDEMAKHFYELGRSEAIQEESRESKNINFSGHKSSEGNSKPKFTMKVVDSKDSRVKVNKRKI